MKLQIECESLLLQKTLENFLYEYISSDDYDLVVTDSIDTSSSKFQFVVAKDGDITVPFSKEKLLESINSRELSSLSLEEEIGELVDNFKIDLLRVVKKYAK